MPVNCPDRLILVRYANGELDDESAIALDSHLSGCETCLAILDSTGSAPPLIAGLRDIAAQTMPVPVVPVSDTQRFPVIPGYEILEVIGQGGMGTVYKARHTRLEKTVAIKVIRGSGEPNAVARFEREMKAVGRLDHPNVVRATDAGDIGGMPFLVMEYVPGIDLSRLVKRDGPLPAHDALALICDLARGLSVAHAAGIVHRDVKPSNAIRTPDGTAKLLDLGLALWPTAAVHEVDSHATVPSQRGLTQTNRIVGTVEYMAPEQAARPLTTDHRADIYGLGATLWYLVTGVAPTQPLLEPLPAGIPADIWHKFLAVDPNERFPSARAALEELSRLAAPPAPSRRRWIAISAAAVLVAVGAGIGFKTWPARRAMVDDPDPDPRPPLGTIPMPAEQAVQLRNAWADYLDRPREPVENSVGMKLALIPPGIMPLSTSCPVTITEPYEMGTCEVTIGQFRQFVQETGYRTFAESHPQGGNFLDWLAPAGQKFKSGPQFNWKTPGHAEMTNDHPVVQITWDDAKSYCEWLSKKEDRNYRLPTEAEWLWAACCGQTEDAIVRADIKSGKVDAWIRSTVGKALRPQPVGKKGQSSWDTFDLWGNVFELCEDDYDALPTEPKINFCARGTHHQFHVMHGYCYYTVSVEFHTSRGRLETCNESTGFRVVREMAKT